MGNAYTGFAELYDRLMCDVDYDAWARYLLRLLHTYLPDTHEPSVADIACGTGSIATRLAGEGCHVTGVDCSTDMLRLAQEKARGHGLAIPFVEQDMRTFSLHRPVNAVFACCDGVNYLTSLADVDAFFASARRALTTDGLLLFDISSEYKLLHLLDGEMFGEVTDELAYIWQNAFDPNTRLIGMALTFFVREGTRYRRFDETHVQRAHTNAEIDALLVKNGFTVLGCYEAFTETPPVAETERIQWIARRSN